MYWNGGQSLREFLHYLDYFFIISPPSSDEGSRHLFLLLKLFEWLRVPVALEKIDGPTTCIPFLGVEIDTNQMILHLCNDI